MTSQPGVRPPLLPWGMLAFALLPAIAFATPPDVTGEWVIIGDHEPRTGRISVVSCHGRRATWRFEVSAEGRVTGTLMPSQHRSGAQRPTRTTASGEVTGAWTEGSLVLSGAESWRTVHLFGSTPAQVDKHPRRFVLTPEKDHLVGTLEERPVRLAPADLSKPKEPCGPPPP